MVRATSPVMNRRSLVRKAAINAIALLAVGSLALTGCGQKNQNTGEKQAGATSSANLKLSDMNPQSRDKVKDGGSLRYSISLLPPNWNPLTVDGNGVDNSTIAHFTLPNNFDFDENAKPTVNKDYMESYDVKEAADNGGKLQVTLHLNPDAKWNSGRTIDYTDYVATWKANNGTNPTFKPATTDGFNQIEKIEKGAKATDVVVTFKSSYPDWTNVLGASPSVLPKEAVTDPKVYNEGMGSANFHPEWHTGPFTLDKIDQAQKTITLKRNEKWWGDKAKLDTVSFRELDESAQTKAFANKEIDVVDTIITKDGYSTAKQRSDAALREAGHLQWRHFTFNSKAGVLADKKVRQAVVKGINREAIARSDLAGLPVNPKDVMLGNHFFMPGQPGYKDNSTKYDPAAAKKELDAAGWKMSGDYRVKDGKQLAFNYSMLTGVPTSENEGALLQQNMKAIGVKVNLVNTASDTYQKVLQNHSFDTISFTWQGTDWPMNNVRQIYGAASEGSKQPSESNYAQIVDPKLEQLIPKIDTEEDQTKRQDLTNQADKIIWDNVHTLPLYRRVMFTAVPKNLANYGAATFQSYRPEDIGFMK